MNMKVKLEKETIDLYVELQKEAHLKNTGVAQYVLSSLNIDLNYIFKNYSLTFQEKNYYSTYLAWYLYWRLYPTFCNEHYTYKEFVTKISNELIKETPPDKFLTSLKNSLRNRLRRNFENNMLFQFNRQYNSYSKSNSKMQVKTLHKSNCRSRTPILGYQYAYYKFHLLITLNDYNSDYSTWYNKLISAFQNEIRSLPNGKQFCTDSSTWKNFVEAYKLIHNYAINNCYTENLPDNYNEIVQLIYYYVHFYTQEGKTYLDNPYLIEPAIPALFELESYYFYYSSYPGTIPDTNEHFDIIDDLELFALTKLEYITDDSLKDVYDFLAIISHSTFLAILKRLSKSTIFVSQERWKRQREFYIPAYNSMGVEFISAFFDKDLLFIDDSSYDFDLTLIQHILSLHNNYQSTFERSDQNDYDTTDCITKILNLILYSPELNNDEKLLCRKIIFNEYVKNRLEKKNELLPEFNYYPINCFAPESAYITSPILSRKSFIEKEYDKYSNLFLNEIEQLLFHHYSNATISNSYSNMPISPNMFHNIFKNKKDIINSLSKLCSSMEPPYTIP